jgi:hypothetical protein
VSLADQLVCKAYHVSKQDGKIQHWPSSSVWSADLASVWNSSTCKMDCEIICSKAKYIDNRPYVLCQMEYSESGFIHFHQSCPFRRRYFLRGQSPVGPSLSLPLVVSYIVFIAHLWTLMTLCSEKCILFWPQNFQQFTT